MSNAVELYTQALAALDAGDRQQGIDLLRQSLELDTYNLEGWLKLAEVMPDSEEKYEILEQILGLDPTNDFANSEWDRLNQLAASGALSEEAGEQDIDALFADTGGEADTRKPKRQFPPVDLEEELVPGITNREALRFGGGLLIFTLFMFICTSTLVGSINSRERNEAATATAQFLAPSQTVAAIDANRTATAAALTQVILDITATVQATITASPSPLPGAGFVRATDIPPTATATELTFRVAPLPPDSVPGTLLAWGDFNPRSREFLPLFTYDPQSATGTAFNNQMVAFPTIDNVGSRVVYLREDTRANEITLDVIPANQPDATPTVLNLLFGDTLSDPQRPSLAATGNYLVFTAQADTGTDEVFLYNFLTEELMQLTRDGSNYTDAAVSPTGTQVVAVKQDPGGGDLALLNVLNATPETAAPQIVLTNDGSDMVEAFPRFASDASRIVYSAAPAETRQAGIYIMDMETFTPTLLLDTPADEIYPHFSPDNRFILYSANPTGIYNLFIYDTIAQLTFQVSESQREPVYAAGWFGQ